jgi:hypothetical protein
LNLRGVETNHSVASFQPAVTRMLGSSIQPGTVSLFSSTGSRPLELFSIHTDSSLPSDSVNHLLHDSTSHPPPPAPAAIISLASSDDENMPAETSYSLDQTVLHIQSPTLKSTYICSPPQHPRRPQFITSSPRHDLGMRHAWLHIQMRNLGREWSFEFGLVDQSGRLGLVRCSTFQVHVSTIDIGAKPFYFKSGALCRIEQRLLYRAPCNPCSNPSVSCHTLFSCVCSLRHCLWTFLCTQKQPRLKLFPGANAPLLHLPLSFPPASSGRLTTWSTLALHLPSLLPHFSSHTLASAGSDFQSPHPIATAIPAGNYSHVAYVKVYATCRLRRIWFSDSGPDQKVPWEFELYGAQ